MNKLVKSALGLMIVTIITKILGFAKDVVLASYYGASGYSDAYIVAFNIPTVIFGSIGVALATAFIPIYQEIKSLEGESKSIDFSNNILNIVLIVSIIISIISYIFADKLVRLFAIGFKGEIFSITVLFTKILVISIIFICMTNLKTSFLQIKNKFIIPGLIGLPFNIIVIISIVLSAKINLNILAYGTLIAFASQWIFLLPFTFKNGFKYKFKMNLNDKYIKKIFILLLPMLIGVAVNQVNVMVDRTLASTLSQGSISALNYANKLVSFIMGLFITSIAAVIYPMLSECSSEKDKTKFNKSVVKSINIIILIIIPITIGAIILSTPIVKILFQRGEFDSIATRMTSTALICYSIGMIGLGLRDILSKIFYSLQDTKTPMINGILTVCLNIILNIILIKYIGHAGLALATSLSSIISIIILFISLRVKIGDFGGKDIITCFIKALTASICMGAVSFLAYKTIINNMNNGFIAETISLIGSVSIGAIMYAIIILLLRVEEVNYILDILKKFLAKNKFIKF